MESRLITVTWKSTLAAWPEKSIYDFYNFEWIWTLNHHYKICLVTIDEDNIGWWLWSWYWSHPLALVVASCHMSPRAQYPRTSEGVPPPNDSIFWISNFSWVIIIDISKGVLSRANIQHPKHHLILFQPPQHDKYWIFIIKYLSIMNLYLTSKASSHLFLTSPAWWTSTSWWSPAPDLKKEWMKNCKK